MKKIIVSIICFAPLSLMAQWVGTNPVYFNAGNVGIGTATPGAKLSFMNVDASTLADGITWYNPSPLDYGLHRTAGTWVAPNYQQLRMSFATGIILNPGASYGKSYVDIQGGGLRVSSGSVGIGTTTATGLLEVKGPYSGNSQVIINTTSSNAELRFSDNGTARGFVWYNKTGDLMAFGRGSATNSIFINSLGNFGLGTNNPGSFKLAVEGKIGAREVNVTTSAWADYVFNSDYKLRSLAEVKTFIDNNNHLPEIPTAKEVEANGINVGEMNTLLLKKIEELTLYMIELKQENDLLKTEVEKIKEKLK